MLNATTEKPCVDCGQAVTVYPPEDGNNCAARCGRCAHTPTAVILPNGAA